MVFNRTLLAAFAALAISAPVFADEATPTTQPATEQMSSSPEQLAEGTTNENQQQIKVDINKATVKQLALVKGLSPSKAKAIITYRKRNGDFKTLEDLKKVKGLNKLNDDQLKEIQDQLSVG